MYFSYFLLLGVVIFFKPLHNFLFLLTIQITIPLVVTSEYANKIQIVAHSKLASLEVVDLVKKIYSEIVAINHAVKDFIVPNQCKFVTKV